MTPDDRWRPEDVDGLARVAWYVGVALFVWVMLSLINGGPWDPLTGTGLEPTMPPCIQRPLGCYHTP